MKNTHGRVLLLVKSCSHKMFEFSSQNFSYFDKVLTLLIMAAAVCTVTFLTYFVHNGEKFTAV